MRGIGIKFRLREAFNKNEHFEGSCELLRFRYILKEFELISGNYKLEESTGDRHNKLKKYTGDRHYKLEECTGDRYY